MKYRFAQARRQQLRLPLSPIKAEMALRALENWRAPADETDPAERTWFRISSQAGDTPTQVNIFDEISWWGISAQEFVDELAAIKGDIEVHINSPGGDAFDGITIYNALAARPGVTTVVDGLAASAASVIAMAGQTRVMSPGSMMMIHDALALCIGNAADMRETAVLLDKVSDNIASVYAAHTSTSQADWRKSMVAEGWYNAQEAVDAGLAHRLAARPGSGSEPGSDPAAAFERSIFALWHGPRNADGNHAQMIGRHTHGHPDGSGGEHSHEHEHGEDGTPDASHVDHEHAEPDGDEGGGSPPMGNLFHVHGQAGECCDKCGPGCQCVERTASRLRVRNSDVDESDWDGPAAMSAASKADDPAAALNAICAGKREGDPKTQEAHALPHHKHPGDPPNRHGVSAALGRIDGTQGLTNKQAAQAHLEAHQSAMGSAADNSSEEEILAIFATELDQLGAGKE